MSMLPFSNLAPFKPRRFVPPMIDLGQWENLEPLFNQLEERIKNCSTPALLEQWLLDWSELNAAIDEESTRRYIAMTCHTDSPEAEQAYLHFLENVEPRIKPRQFKLSQLYVAHPARERLPRQRYLVFDRDTKNQVEVFRPENVPLETEEAKVSQQYQKLMGSLTVNFRGEEKTLIQMGKYQEEPDRALRQEAWELVTNRRLQEREKFDDLFDHLIRVRAQIAKNAGFENYRDYMFRRLGRFDYTPDDCATFHQAVEQEIMPILSKLQAERKDQLRVETLRPWDSAVDPLNRAPLKPFKEVDELITRTQRIFDRLDGELASGFRQMQDLKLLDLANRKGKAPGGYQSNLSEARVPFIFMNAVGIQQDVETILHEAGHAFHALAAQKEDLFPYRSAPIEFCEVASMSMELIGNELLPEAFYDEGNSARARRAHLEAVLTRLAWIATVDAFQHWIYTHPGHSREDRRQAWMRLMDRFGGNVDWSGYEMARACLWHRQLHIFIHPFYYIEYGIAQLGALQVWAAARQDRSQALQKYKAALSLGGSRPLPALFEAAGCRFEFSQKTIGPLAKLVREELAAMPA